MGNPEDYDLPRTLYGKPVIISRKMSIKFQRPATGSKPWYGNFSLGLLFDNHPRFTTVITALVFFEIVISVKDKM